MQSYEYFHHNYAGPDQPVLFHVTIAIGYG
jgi:hypothetical protein